MVIGIAASQNRRSNPETESSHAAEMQDATSTALRIRMLIQRIIFCTTLDVVARRRRTHRAKRTRELIRRCHPRRVRPVFDL